MSPELTLQPFRVDAAVEREIRRHGEETYPHECCGALVGSPGRATATVALPNTTEEGPRRRFLVRPSDYRLAEQKATELGGELLGFYHSHPDHPAQWSPTDFAEAHWLGCSYVITAVANGKATVTNSFLLAGTTEEDKRYEQETIAVDGVPLTPTHI